MMRYDLGPDITVHMHACGEGGIFVNGYLVETGRSVVAIDSTLTESESRGFRRELEGLEKPLVAVLVTHPHPRPRGRDHQSRRERRTEDHRHAAGPGSHAHARGAEAPAVDARVRGGVGAEVDLPEHDRAAGQYAHVRRGQVWGPRPWAGRRRRGEHGLVHRIAEANSVPRGPGVQRHALVCRGRLPPRMARQPRPRRTSLRGDGHRLPRTRGAGGRRLSSSHDNGSTCWRLPPT
jgi:hypothetical protein